jgi:hypothetical protein
LNPDEYLNCDLRIGVHSKAPARAKERLVKKNLVPFTEVVKNAGPGEKLLQAQENFLCGLIDLFNRQSNNYTIYS